MDNWNHTFSGLLASEVSPSTPEFAEESVKLSLTI